VFERARVSIVEDVERGGLPLVRGTPPLAQLPCDQRQAAAKKQQRGWFGNERLAVTASADRVIRGYIGAAIRRGKCHHVLIGVRPFMDVDAVTETARMILAAGVIPTAVVLTLVVVVPTLSV